MIFIKTFGRGITLLAFLSLLACGGNDPASLRKEIADLQAKNFPMTAEQKTEFAELAKKGDDLLKDGKTNESAKVLKQALAILKQAEDAAMFNKSE